jgi:hypothetical protein
MNTINGKGKEKKINMQNASQTQKKWERVQKGCIFNLSLETTRACNAGLGNEGHAGERDTLE